MAKNVNIHLYREWSIYFSTGYLEVIDIVFNLGKRKVQKTRYTFLLPIPATWAKNMNLIQGSDIDIELMEDNSLKLTPAPKTAKPLEPKTNTSQLNEEVSA